jgi:hypothetical protein
MTAAGALRDRNHLLHDSVELGPEMTPLVIGPVTTIHPFRWSAAIENWHRIHYDESHAIDHAALPGVVLQRSRKKSLPARDTKDLCLPDGWARRPSFRLRAMIVKVD